jgi:MFS transporter, OFA family, oxalate/formate antiporter
MTKLSKLKNPIVILAAATGINLTLGVLYSWSIISKDLVLVLGWSNSAASLPYTVAIIVFAIALLVAGRLQDKMGPKRFVIAGVILVGLGLIASSFSTSPAMMMISYGVLVGTGIGFGYSCVTPAVMKWWHQDKKGLVTGIVVGGFGVASVYVAPVTTMLLQNYGLEVTFRLLGVFVLFAGLPLSMLITNPPEGYTPAAPLQKKNAPRKLTAAACDYEWKEMLKTPQFYLLWVMFALASSAGLMIIGSISIIAKQQAAFEAGFLLVVLLAIFNAAGRIFGGMLSDKIGRIRTLQLMIILQGLNMLAFAFYTSPFTIAIGTAAAGVAYGSLLSLFPSITSDYYGMKNFGLNYGILYTAWGISGAIGPVIASAVADATGTFVMAYMISAGLLALTLGLNFVLKPLNSKTESSQEKAASA